MPSGHMVKIVFGTGAEAQQFRAAIYDRWFLRSTYVEIKDYESNRIEIKSSNSKSFDWTVWGKKYFGTLSIAPSDKIHMLFMKKQKENEQNEHTE